MTVSLLTQPEVPCPELFVQNTRKCDKEKPDFPKKSSDAQRSYAYVVGSTAALM